MNDYVFPDVGAVRAQARVAWEKRERRRLGIQERIGQSVPWWLILIAAVFYLVSAPHTAATFDQLTPGWGWAAPLGVEFGLLYAAFRRRQTDRPPRTLRMLEWLLFVTAIVVNGAGAFGAVVEATGLQDLSLGAMADAFGHLPATSQVALALVPLAALIIPIGTSVAGEGMAALLLERRSGGDIMEVRWREMGQEIEYLALRDAALANGVPPSPAKEWARRITGWGASVRPSVSVVSGADSADVRTGADSGHLLPARTDGAAMGAASRAAGRSDARVRVRDYVARNPGARQMNVRELASAAGVGKTTAAEVLKEMRER